MGTHLTEIENFFKDKEFGEEKIALSPSDVIINQKKFYEIHLSILKSKAKSSIKMPYYDRLNKFYEIIKGKWEKQKS